MTKTNILRVTQMNAVYFDNEINKLFSKHIQDCLKHLPPGFTTRFNNEISLLLKLAILHYSIIKCNSTFGQKLLSVKYDNLNTLKKLLFVIGSCFGYIKDRAELWNPSHNINRYISKINAAIQVCSFINISIFLRTGVRPQLVERILGLDHVFISENLHRHYESKYMTRELLWDSFIEVLVYVLPLVNYHKVKRTVKRLNSFHKKTVIVPVKSRNYTYSTKCPHCGEGPILPHHMGCIHIFCYSCLKGNQMADKKYECPVCEYSSFNNICERVTVDG